MALIFSSFIFLLLFMLYQFGNAGEWIDSRFKSEFGSRNYKVYLPTKLAGAKPSKLIVMLHGCGQTSQEFAELTQTVTLANEKNIVLIFPEQSSRDNLMRCWNFSSTANHYRGRGETALIIGLLDHVIENYEIDESRIYVAGISAGGALTSLLLATYPERFAAGFVAAGAMARAAQGPLTGLLTMSSGSLFSPTETAIEIWQNMKIRPKSIPVMIIHGDQDRISSPINAQQTAEQFSVLNDLLDDGLLNSSVSITPSDSGSFTSEMGIITDWKTYGQSVTGNYLLIDYRVRSMGHHWSGGPVPLEHSFPKGPNQSLLMWNFFARHFR